MVVSPRHPGLSCECPGRQDRRGRTIGIKVRLDDFSTHTRARTLPRAINAAAEVGGVARELLREFASPRPVRLLGVRVASFEAAADDAAPQLALPALRFRPGRTSPSPARRCTPS